ncbi:MAG: SAM-dependent methyltransferase [Blastocatellia bacterium]
MKTPFEKEHRERLAVIAEIYETENREKASFYTPDEIRALDGHRQPVGFNSLDKEQWYEATDAEQGAVDRYILGRPGCQVLDAGCGWGTYSFLFGFMGARVRGIDVDTDRLAFARKRLEVLRRIAGSYNLPLDVSFEKADIFATMKSQAYDVIWVREAISHIHPIEGFFDAVSENISPDGIMAISDQNWQHPKTKIDLIREFRDKWRPFSRWGEATIWYVFTYTDPETGAECEMSMERVFSPWKLKRVVRQSNLRIVESKTIGFLPKGYIAGLFPGDAKLTAYKRLMQVDNVIGKIPIIRDFGTKNILIAGRGRAHS